MNIDDTLSEKFLLDAKIPCADSLSITSDDISVQMG